VFENLLKKIEIEIFFLPVSQLRGHWEDTSSKVLARRNQLEDLIVDNQQFESKRREIESWLSRMEGWKARMRPIGSTPDVLEQQVREQKVLIGLELCQSRIEIRKSFGDYCFVLFCFVLFCFVLFCFVLLITFNCLLCKQKLELVFEIEPLLLGPTEFV
jgi:hypothetical protein